MPDHEENPSVCTKSGVGNDPVGNSGNCPAGLQLPLVCVRVRVVGWPGRQGYSIVREAVSWVWGRPYWIGLEYMLGITRARMSVGQAKVGHIFFWVTRDLRVGQARLGCAVPLGESWNGCGLLELGNSTHW